MDITVTIVTMIPVILAVALIVSVVRKNITREPGEPLHIVEAVPAVVVLLVAVMIIGSMASSIDNEFELYDCVPLSSFGSGATIEGDCAEIVTIGGEQYVRMTDLGTFSVVSGDSSKEYTVTKAKMDLVLLTGQSNTILFSSPYYYGDAESPVAPGKAFYLGDGIASGTVAGIAREDTLASSTIRDLVDSDGGVEVASMYPAFCSGYVNETGHRVLVVNTGVAGKDIAKWDDGSECDLWMKAVFDRLEEIVSDGSIALTSTAVLWSQGHADANKTQEYYEEKLVSLLERFWGGDYGYKFKNVLSVLPRHAGYTNPINPALAQLAVAEDYSGFTIASSLPVHFTSAQMRDSAHYTQEAFGWLGEAFARSAAEVMGYMPEAETLVMLSEIGEVASVDALPSTIDLYGTSGQTFTLSAAWSVTDDPSVYSATLSGMPSGTVTTEEPEAYPCISDLFTYDAAGTTITGLSTSGATATHLVLPSEHGGETVIAVGASAFAGNTTITYVAVLDDCAIASIGANAFDGCTSLAHLELSDTMTTFGDYAFRGCRALTEFAVPDGTTTIPGRMLGTCTSLESVAIPDSVTKILIEAFRGCTSLESVELSSSLTQIGGNVFYGCTGITSVSFESGFSASLGNNCFNDWTFYDTDGTTVIDKTVASNLAGHTFTGTASALVMQS